MLVWSTPASQYLDPDYCRNTHHGCDIVMGKQEAIWVNAFSFLGCIFSVPFAGLNSTQNIIFMTFFMKDSQWDGLERNGR